MKHIVVCLHLKKVWAKLRFSGGGRFLFKVGILRRVNLYVISGQNKGGFKLSQTFSMRKVEEYNKKKYIIYNLNIHIIQ